MGLNLSWLPGGLLAASADTFQRKAAEVLARPEFDLAAPKERESSELLQRVLRWLLGLFSRFLEALGFLPAPLRWLVVFVLTVLLVVLVVHIVWSFSRAIRGVARRKVVLKSEDSNPRPEEFESAAARQADSGDFIGAIRLLFKACLLRVEAVQKQPFRRGVTNREILRNLRATSIAEPLNRIVEIIDTRWYGHLPCNQDDYAECQTASARIRGLIERRTHAVGA
jgi:hypothetical protein